MHCFIFRNWPLIEKKQIHHYAFFIISVYYRFTVVYGDTFHYDTIFAAKKQGITANTPTIAKFLEWKAFLLILWVRAKKCHQKSL